MDALNVIVKMYEAVPSIPFVSSCLPVREYALKTVYTWIKREDENTGYQTIGPVSKAMNMVARFHREGRDSEAFKRHLSRVDDFLWLGKDGMMMMGTNGSQLWDTAFMAQAAIETGLADEEENHESVLQMLDWLDKCQIQENPKYYVDGYRHRTKGAWPFSTPEQNYTVSDCTAEGLKAVIGIQKLSYTPKAVSLDRLRDAVDTLLSMQNANGGYCSYELQRGSERMEWLNAAEVFGESRLFDFADER
jgi:lanosterol synthase